MPELDFMTLNPKVEDKKVCYLNGAVCEKYLDFSCKAAAIWSQGTRIPKECPEDK